MQPDLGAIWEQVARTGEAVEITWPGREAMAMLPAADLRSMLETLYLLSSRANARALFDAMDRAERGWAMSKPPAAWEIVLLPGCLQDLAYWVETDRALALKALELIKQASRDPLGGLGKPEQLKHLGSGYVSRRISQEHHLMYRVVGRTIQFLSARFHYGKK